MEITYRLSDNFKHALIVPEYIIIHCIGGTKEHALNTLTLSHEKGGGGVSAHYFIPAMAGFGIYQLVADNETAFHAGKSQWHQQTLLNTCSIGIEFHSPNYANALSNPDALNWFHFEEFPVAQIKVGINLIKSLMKKYAIKPENILAHSDIAPWRIEEASKKIILAKTDPGATFPWEDLAREGIGVWPKFSRTRSGELDTTVKHAQTLLSTFGYALDITGEMDLKTQYVLRAFQLHFMPTATQIVINEQLIIYLENLIDKQYK